MILGKKQMMYVDHKTDFGLYLADSEPGDKKQDCVLLPRKQVPPGLKRGDEIEVFLYRDSDDRLIATRETPAIELGQLGVLEVAQVNKIGAFLKWGLSKDLLLPYSEQTRKVEKGDRLPAVLYVDKSSRLCATMKVYDYLSTDSPYRKEDMVSALVISLNPEYGAFVAVDRLYHGLIQKKELIRKVRPGEEVECRVVAVREDGKLNLSLRRKAYIQMDEDAMKIDEMLKENDGFLPFHDKSAPEDIRREFGMSKNEFKRAIGRLYKMRRIRIEKDGIYSLPSDDRK